MEGPRGRSGNAVYLQLVYEEESCSCLVVTSLLKYFIIRRDGRVLY